MQYKKASSVNSNKTLLKTHGIKTKAGNKTLTAKNPWLTNNWATTTTTLILEKPQKELKKNNPKKKKEDEEIKKKRKKKKRHVWMLMFLITLGVTKNGQCGDTIQNKTCEWSFQLTNNDRLKTWPETKHHVLYYHSFTSLYIYIYIYI